MAQKNTPGAKTFPRLVVKIMGSKQVRQFIEAFITEVSDNQLPVFMDIIALTLSLLRHLVYDMMRVHSNMSFFILL